MERAHCSRSSREVCRYSATGCTSVVNKKETLSLSTGEMTIAKKIAEESYDAWDKRSMDYHEAYSRANSFAERSKFVRAERFDYYGNFVNVPGIWIFLATVSGWLGLESLRKWSLGRCIRARSYSWVSPYPWGWLPYHSGGWSVCSRALGGDGSRAERGMGLNNVAYTGGQPVGVAGVGAGAGTGTAGLVGGKPVHSPLRAAVMPQASVGYRGREAVAGALEREADRDVEEKARRGTLCFSAGFGWAGSAERVFWGI